MVVGPGCLWHHVMRFADGQELHLDFVFLEVEPPSRLVWRHVDHGMRKQGPPTCRTTITLDDLGGRTHLRMVADIFSIPQREAAGVTPPPDPTPPRNPPPAPIPQPHPIA